MIALLPALGALRRRYPGARIVLGVQPNCAGAELATIAGSIDAVRVLDFMSAMRRRDRLRGAWQLFREGFDVLICVPGYFLIRDAFFCGAPLRIGLYDGRRNGC